ncbi:hypothetical protein BDN72DRAFT_873108 [Pluteus cervinus]|uniref:Uncharacterized protein n=1 Tax=Pluteus cervinus TaxID=181527 RepID=A0ACD3A029_9AGAR|nr:hypothetical protein BDN72DRAFT_873108 [Pluteus cervinus]
MAALSNAAQAAHDFANLNRQIEHIHFFTDNTSAISTIFNPGKGSCQLYASNFHQLMCKFLDGDPGNTLDIAWCPSHSEILGNTRADALAKEACELDWSTSPRLGGSTIANRIPPSLNPTPHFKTLRRNRELFGRIVQCRTGHAYTAILGTHKGIIALTQFLKDSGAFTCTGKDILPRSLPEFIDKPLPQID